MTRTPSDGERAVLNAAADLETWRTANLAEHPAVSVGERQVFNILNRSAERDDALIAREHDRHGYTYHDDGIHELNDQGEVTLDPVDLDNAGSPSSTGAPIAVARRRLRARLFRRRRPRFGRRPATVGRRGRGVHRVSTPEPAH